MEQSQHIPPISSFQNGTNKPIVNQQNIQLVQNNEKDNYKDQKLNTENNTSNKYKIIDLFWIINEKINNKELKILPNEADFVIISFNVIFGNLKITYYKIPQGAIHKNVVFQNKLQRLTSGTIYPGSCFKLLSNPITNFCCMEQLIIDTGEEWQKNRPICILNKTENEIELEITEFNNKYFYNFHNWNKELFLHCCSFLVNQGFNLTSQYKINN